MMAAPGVRRGGPGRSAHTAEPAPLSDRVRQRTRSGAPAEHQPPEPPGNRGGLTRAALRAGIECSAGSYGGARVDRATEFTTDRRQLTASCERFKGAHADVEMKLALRDKQRPRVYSPGRVPSYYDEMPAYSGPKSTPSSAGPPRAASAPSCPGTVRTLIAWRMTRRFKATNWRPQR